MDTVTRDLVFDWMADPDLPDDWLPLRGDTAKAEIWRFHEARYTEPQGLTKGQIATRRLARDAYASLALRFTQFGFASSSMEAKRMVWEFSFAANSHPEGGCERLARISTDLRVCLRPNGQRPSVALGAASACLSFIGHGRLDSLESALSGLVS